MSFGIVEGILLAIAIASAVATFIMMSSMGGQGDNGQQPRTDLNYTSVEEGRSVIVAYGTVKITGTLLHYGNVASTEVTRSVDTGSGDTDVVTGYRYYCDAWQAIACGKYELIKTYQNDVEQPIEAAETVFNDGTEDEYASWLINTQASGGAHAEVTGVSSGGVGYNATWDAVLRTPVKEGTVNVTYQHWLPDFRTHDSGGILYTQEEGLACGTINYETGALHVTNLAPNNEMKCSYNYGTQYDGAGGMRDDEEATTTGYGNLYMTLMVPVKPKTITIGYKLVEGGVSEDTINATRMYDDGAGKIWNVQGIEVGTINYTTGELICSGLLTMRPVVVWYNYGINTMDFPTPLNGICNIAWKRWYVGENTWNIPNVHFVVKRILTTPLAYTEETSGQNPAAVIWDILTNTFYGMGEPTARMNLTSFNAASTWWHNQGYGINFAITRAGKVEDHINRILGWVGGSLYKDIDGKWAIQTFDPSIPAVCTLQDEDFKKFKIFRHSWFATENEIRATWVDKNNHYVQKMVPIRDPANQYMQDRVVAISVDLSCFTDTTALSKRMWEILRYRSYPRARCEFTISEKYSSQISAGSVVAITNSEYGMTEVKFRITKVPSIKPDSLEVSYEAEQVVEAITDGSFTTVIPEESSRWVVPIVDPVNLAYSAVFELPWTEGTGSEQAFLLLMARAGIEDGAEVIQSLTGSDYTTVANINRFAQRGTLKTTYPATTYEIDDAVGILYTPYKNDPAPDDLSRQNLFLFERYVIIDSEIMRFQYQTPEGQSDYRLTGVIRGCHGTAIASHTAGAAVWIVEPGNNLRIITIATTFYLKFLTKIASRQLSAASATPVTVTPTGKAKVPWPVTKLEATRDGSNNIVVIWWPRTRDFIGAGQNAEATVDTSPFNFDGDFQYRINSGTPVTIVNTTYTWNVSGQVTFEVRQRIESQYSDWVSVTVGAAAGRYVNGISGALGY